MKLIISTSLFYMKNGYRSFDKYLNGLLEWKKIVETYLNKYSVTILVYYDDSIKKDNKIFNKFNQITKDKLFETKYFNCPEFKSKTHDGHLSTFTTMARFLPLFEKDDDSIVMIRDLDIYFTENNSYNHLYDFFENSRYSMLFYDNYLQYKPPHLKILPDNKYKKPFLANGIFKNKWDKHLFDKFLKDTNDETSNIYKYIQQIKKLDRRNSVESNIVYGYDELFLNYVLLNNVSKNDRIKIIRFFDDKYYLLKKLKLKFPEIKLNDFHEIYKNYQDKLSDDWNFVLNNWNQNKTYTKIFI